MSSTPDSPPTAVVSKAVQCVRFEPQEWRRTLCKNCFKTAEQHKPDWKPIAESSEVLGDLSHAERQTAIPNNIDQLQSDTGGLYTDVENINNGVEFTSALEISKDDQSPSASFTSSGNESEHNEDADDGPEQDEDFVGYRNYVEEFGLDRFNMSAGKTYVSVLFCFFIYSTVGGARVKSAI